MIKFFLTGLLLIFTNSYSQYTQQWVNRLNGTASSFDIANNMFLDEQSNVYVYSTISNTNNITDISAIKYDSQGNIVWQYVYSSPGIDQLQDVYKDAFNNSYITGYTQDSGQIKLLTLKLNPFGDTVWTRISSIAGYENLISRSIAVDNTGNVFVLVDAKNISNSRIELAIIKYNQFGIIAGTKVYQADAKSYYSGRKLICDAQNNLFVGSNYRTQTVGLDIMIFKLDNNLNEMYYRVINETASWDDELTDMKLAYDNNVIFTGSVCISGSGTDIGTYKINNQNGIVIWRKVFNGGGTNNDYPYAMTFDNSNNIFLTGFSRAGSSGTEDAVLLKYDKDGVFLWGKMYDDSTHGSNQGFSVCADTQNNIYVGAASDIGSGHLGYLTLKYDTNGNFLWKGSYHYYHLSEDFIYKIAVNSSQDIFVTGISFSNTADYDVATIKYARQTGIYTITETLNDFKLYSNYPNPFNPSTKIRFYNPERNFISIKVYDLNGREVVLLENRILNAGNYEYEFKAENLSSGVYLYKVFYGENFKTGKMIYNK